MTILEQILEVKQKEVRELLTSNPILKSSRIHSGKPSLFNTLKNATQLQVISEIKRASPSKGMINANINPIKQARLYEQSGASAISVLTDEVFFKGSIEDLRDVAQTVSIPVLCKDFIIDSSQIDRAYEAGASVVLLIVAALSQQTLRQLYDYASSLKLEVLVEVHNLEELERAIAIPAKLIGVNNRDLKTFKVDLSETEKIAAQFPFHEERVLISESGIETPGDAKRVAKAGASAILVGETLMKSTDVEHTLLSFQVKLGEEQ
ncbi:MAG: indole-3-glycerol phosphate synthase TrpC [Firmicutes bacterium]|nr:indole-3-glycerol phosphate synthase TrpC [Bacillota bacterium]